MTGSCPELRGTNLAYRLGTPRTVPEEWAQRPIPMCEIRELSTRLETETAVPQGGRARSRHVSHPETR